MNESPKRTRVMIHAIVVLWVIIIGAFVYSTFFAPPPYPSAQFNLSLQDREAFVTHAGGDPLPCGNVAVFLDDTEVPFPGGEIDCPWSIGETLPLTLPRSVSPATLRVYYVASPRERKEIFSATVSPWALVSSPSETTLQQTPAPSPAETPATPAATPSTLRPTPPPTLIPIDTLGAPLASFVAEPRSGPVPLTVRFTDTSRGIPAEWLWTFGDGETSDAKNPVHTYMREGSYDVGLTVRNQFGGHTKIGQGFITVVPAQKRDIFFEGQRDAYVPAGGFLDFVVTEAGSRAKVGGTVIELPVGSRVRFTLASDGKGRVSIRSGKILAFAFDNTVLSIDGEVRAAGAAQDTSVQGYRDLISGLGLVVSGGPGEIRFLDSGSPVELAEGRAGIRFVSLAPDTAGILVIDCSRPGATLVQAGVSGYSFG